ncbi:MAG: sulfatase [Candidatus Brocadia sp.]
MIFSKKYKSIYTPCFVLCFLLILLGCQKKKKNVVVISIDTLRADHMGCYGYTRNTTPAIDALSNEGCVFTNVTSTSSWTAPAMASLFTTLMPSQHNIRHGVCQSGNIYGQEILDASHMTLAEVLKENGLTTLGISSNPHLTPELGFAQGFDHFVVCKFKNAEEITKTAIEFMTQYANGKPFFLWVHYFDPHWPYSKQEPWFHTYAPDYQDELRQFYDTNLPKVRTAAGIEKGTKILQSLVALYDSEINYVDQSVGKLLDAIQGRGNTMIVLVSDHGEGFLEHDTLDHGYQLYEESIHVPLIIRCPNVKPAKKSFNTTCSIIDIPLTILDWLGIKDRYHFQGRSLLPFMKGKISDDTGESNPAAISELNRFGKNLISMRVGKWKYINDRKYGKEELYDLMADPYETTNIIEREPLLHAEMKNRLSNWLVATRKPKSKAKRAILDQESLEKLRSLGYLE